MNSARFIYLSILVLLPLNCIASPWRVIPTHIGEPYEKAPIEPPRPEFPDGASILSRGATITSSDPQPLIGRLDFINDGNRGAWNLRPSDNWADEGYFVELIKGHQFIQLDLHHEAIIDAVWIWQRHPCESFEAPHDVAVLISNDPNFKKEYTVVFNSDRDNSLGLGTGKDTTYLTSRYGKLIRVSAISGRYVRLWSNGSWRRAGVGNMSCLDPSKTPNAWVEVEVHGRPVRSNGSAPATTGNQHGGFTSRIPSLITALIIISLVMLFLFAVKRTSSQRE